MESIWYRNAVSVHMCVRLDVVSTTSDMGRQRRFKALLGGLNYLRPISGGVSPEAPAGTALRNFQEYRAGRVNRTVTRAATSNPGARTEYRLSLFGAPTASDTADILLGQRARDGLGQLQGLTLTVLGLSTGATDPPQFTGIFTPAKVTCFRREGTATTSRRSQITGINRRTANGNSYTYSFGKVAESDRYLERASTIDNATGAGIICSFQPEDIISI